MQASSVRSDTFGTTIGTSGNPEFTARSHRIPVPPRLNKLPREPFNLRDELTLCGNILGAARRKRALLLHSGRGRLKPEVLACACIGLWPGRLRPAVVLHGEMFEPNRGVRNLVDRALIKLADRAVTRYAVHSEAEGKVFARLWNIDPAKIRACHITWTVPPWEERVPLSERSAHVFAGGDAVRDYAPLVDAARRMPEVSFVFATKLLQQRTDLPPNVQAGPLPQDEFKRLSDTAAAVAVPLRLGMCRSAGQMTYLQAMVAATPVIVTDALAVREYVDDRQTGLVVDGTADGYVAALRWVLNPANRSDVAAMCERAYKHVAEQHRSRGRLTRLMHVMDEVLGLARREPPEAPRLKPGADETKPAEAG